MGANTYFLTRSGRTNLLKAVDKGIEPSDFFYGFYDLCKKSDRFEIVEVHQSNEWFSNKLNGFSQNVIGHNFHLLSTLRVLVRLPQNSILYTNIDSIALPIAFFRMLGFIQFDHIHLSQGLTNFLEKTNKQSFRFRLGCSILSLLLKHVSDLLVLGEGARSALTEYLKTKSNCLQFGVDHSFWQASESDPGHGTYLLTVGSDSNRDFDTLKRLDPRYEIRVVTRLHLGELPPHMKLVDCEDSLELRNLIHNAKLVIVSLNDISQPSGQSTALQAMAMGKPVILTDNRGLWDRQNLIDHKNLRLVPLFDEQAIELAIDQLVGDFAFSSSIGKCAKKTVEKHYTIQMMSDRLMERFDLLHFSLRKRFV
ncbi:MAG: hypothetical protein MI748_09475 [Opitutales bacterium]|nr:hypothetical protein [Opitutales bacterium]